MKVPDMHRSRWKNGDWTDDTDQMILIMISIIENNGKVSVYEIYSHSPNKGLNPSKLYPHSPNKGINLSKL